MRDRNRYLGRIVGILIGLMVGGMPGGGTQATDRDLAWSRHSSLSDRNPSRSDRVLPEIEMKREEPAKQTLKFGNIAVTKPLDPQTNFLASGKKIYEFGAMEGTFPPVGRDNIQGGIWCHPIKVMDRFEVRILEEGQNPVLLQGSTRFVQEFASCTFYFAGNGMTMARQDFAAEEEPALFSRVTLHNTTNKPRTLDLQFSGWVRIRPSWGSGLPDRGEDILAYQPGVVSAYNKAMEHKWGVVFGCAQAPARHEINGNCGILTYPVRLPAGGEKTLTFLILGEHEQGVEAAQKKFQSLLGQAPKLLAQKQRLYRDRILGGVQFACSDRAIEDAFYCAKANVLMSVMDLRPYFVAPYLAAGFPVYTWLFGCDSCYSTAGVAAAGFPEEARGTLECLLHYAAQEKRAAHEVVSNGRLLGTDHVQETPQFVLACWKHFQWTADRAFLQQAYPICRDMVENVLKTSDKQGDGYLEGPGLMEEAGMGPKRLDSACYLYAAYGSLAEMAEVLGEPGAENYRLRAAVLKVNFNRDFWNAKEQMWACSLRQDHTQTMDNFWAVIFPQEVGIADLDKAQIALDRIEKEWVNEEWGYVAQWAPNITGRGVGVVHNNICALTAFRYGRADLGYKLMRLSAKAPLEERMLGAFDETMPGGGDTMQLWSFGPYLEAVIGGLVGIHPAASAHSVEIYPQMPERLTSYTLHRLKIGDHTLNVEWKREGRSHLLKIAHPTGPQGLTLLLRIDRNHARTLELNGKMVRPKLETSQGVETSTAILSLPPGKSVTVRLTE